MADEGTLGGGIDNSAAFEPEDFFRSRSMAWVEDTLEEEAEAEAEGEEDKRPKHPPDCLALYPDLVEKGWGWKRLVPGRIDGCVKWPDLKRYLVSYYQNTDIKVDQLIGKRKPDPVRQRDKIAAKDDALLAAVNKCVEAECKLVRTCRKHFTIKDCLLSRDIRERARQLLQSGCESSAAAAALLCITKEDELICDLFTPRCRGISEELALANVVRQSASNFILFKGSESDAASAAGIMLGLAREAEEAMLARNSEDWFATANFFNAVTARHRVVTVLTKLEEDLISKTADTDGDGNPIGVSADRVLNSKGSGSTGSSKEDMTNHTGINMNLKGNMRMRNKNLNDQVGTGAQGKWDQALLT